MRALAITTISLIIALNLTLPAQADWTADLALTSYQTRFYRIDHPQEYSIVSKSKGYGITYFVPAPDSERLKNLRIRILVLNFSSDLKDYSQAVANEFKRESVNGTFEYATMDSEAAIQFVYETKGEQGPVKTVRTYTIKAGRVFDLQFSFPAHRDNELRPLVERLIDSFRMSGVAK